MSRGPYQTNPYGSIKRARSLAAASRDAGLEFPGLRVKYPSVERMLSWDGFRFDLELPGSRGGPIGVVKLLRARGGCLGVIRDRAWKAAKSPGELPNERRARNARATQGTETSQYLEEKKSTETPSVAASERGQA